MKFYITTHDDPPRRLVVEAENIQQANEKARAMGLRSYTINNKRGTAYRVNNDAVATNETKG